ncbi:hypothetical protein J0H33_16845 [bacterium]|nr:hypothetical protein [bacterium]
MSTIRPAIRLRLRPILIGATAVLAAAALVPVAAAAPSGHLEFRLSGPSPQDVVTAGGIKVNARCPADACTVVASATSKNPALHTDTARAKIGAGKAKAITMPLATGQREKLEAAIKAGKPPTFTVKATAHDSGGTHVPLTIQVKVHPPKH